MGAEAEVERTQWCLDMQDVYMGFACIAEEYMIQLSLF